MSIHYPQDVEWVRGWNDCRFYAGEESDQPACYHEGFDACLEAYHASAAGWSLVPRYNKPGDVFARKDN